MQPFIVIIFYTYLKGHGEDIGGPNTVEIAYLEVT